MHQTSGFTSPGDREPDLLAYRRGEPGAADRLLDSLRPPVARDVARLLGAADHEVDDVVQESLVATMQYLARDVEFEGDLVRLAVTIARNRCRDLLRWRRRRPRAGVESLAGWLADPSRSALDELEAAERRESLQRALSRISGACRDLLAALYLEELPTETVRARLGLGTVQGVYYRREKCLRRLKKFLQETWSGRSGVGDWRERPTGGGAEHD